MILMQKYEFNNKLFNFHIYWQLIFKIDPSFLFIFEYVMLKLYFKTFVIYTYTFEKCVSMNKSY